MRRFPLRCPFPMQATAGLGKSIDQVLVFRRGVVSAFALATVMRLLPIVCMGISEDDEPTKASAALQSWTPPVIEKAVSRTVSLLISSIGRPLELLTTLFAVFNHPTLRISQMTFLPSKTCRLRNVMSSERSCGSSRPIVRASFRFMRSPSAKSGSGRFRGNGKGMTVAVFVLVLFMTSPLVNWGFVKDFPALRFGESFFISRQMYHWLISLSTIC